MSLFDQIAQRHYSNPPEGWETRKIKFLTNIQTSNVDKLSDDDEVPVRLCNYTDVYYNDHITPDLPFMDATASPKEIEKFTLKAGQVFITKDSEEWDDIGIPALVTEDMPGVLCGYHLAIFTPEPEKLNGAFLAWLCRADALNDQFKLSANGVTRFGLGQYAMKNAVVGFPPLETQKRIASFLDEKTARIDGLIEKKRALLERLAEKRQAIITQAVTKGLNPVVPLKDSALDWLGQIPAHWEVVAVKYLITVATSGPRGWSEMTTDTGALFFRSQNIGRSMDVALEDVVRVEPADDAESRRARLQNDDVVVCITGARTGAVGHISGLERAYINQHVCMLRPSPDMIMGRYLAYCLSSYLGQEQLGIATYGLKQGLGLEQVRSLSVMCPSEEEQEGIVSFLDEATTKIETLITAAGRTITLLNEHRSALITAAVTGQIDGLR